MLATIDWVNLHDKIGFFIVVAAFVGAIVALLSLVTPFVGVVLKIYLRLLLLAHPHHRSFSELLFDCSYSKL